MEYCASFVWFELSQGKEEGEAGGKVEEGCGVSQHWVCGEELIEPGAPPMQAQACLVQTG